jgi:hypothetical protein
MLVSDENRVRLITGYRNPSENKAGGVNVDEKYEEGITLYFNTEQSIANFG